MTKVSFAVTNCGVDALKRVGPLGVWPIRVHGNEVLLVRPQVLPVKPLLFSADLWLPRCTPTPYFVVTPSASVFSPGKVWHLSMDKSQSCVCVCLCVCVCVCNPWQTLFWFLVDVANALEVRAQETKCVREPLSIQGWHSGGDQCELEITAEKMKSCQEADEANVQRQFSLFPDFVCFFCVFENEMCGNHINLVRTHSEEFGETRQKETQSKMETAVHFCSSGEEVNSSWREAFCW